MRRILTMALILLLCAGLTGCFSTSAEELLAQPKLPRDAEQLQNQIKKQLETGEKLVAPVGGVNRQTIQMVDIDGDGVDEAAVFYRGRGETPLSIVFYRKYGETYEPLARIEGEGEAVDSVAYVDMNLDGLPEVLVGWRVGLSTLKALTVYTLSEERMRKTLSVSYSGYAFLDLTGDGHQELLVLRHDGAELAGAAEMYGFDGADIELVSEAELSKGIEVIQRLKTGLLSDGVPAVFVTSRYGAGAAVTDILAVRDGQLRNITQNASTGVSDMTVRQYTQPVGVDIDADGALDLPAPRELPPYNPDAGSQDFLGTVIEWRSYNVRGEWRPVKTTWHNYADMWYFELPENWVPSLTTTQRALSTDEKGYVFAMRRRPGEPPLDLLAFYTLTGDDRNELAEKDGRIVVLSRSDKIVVAEILATGSYAIDEAELIQRVIWIQNEWITGELNLG